MKDGLREGSDVLLNPRTNVVEANEEHSIEERNAKKNAQAEKFGSTLGDKRVSPSKQKSGKKKKKKNSQGPGGLMRFDTNKDGKLSRQEVDHGTNGRMSDAFQHIDKNQDGFIDRSEMTAAQAGSAAGGRAGATQSRPKGDR